MAKSKKDLTVEQVRRVLGRKAKQLLAMPGVTSCGVGYRETNGKRTDELCIQCTVEKKMSAPELVDRGVEPLPESITAEGVEVGIDVIERNYGVHYQLDGEADVAECEELTPEADDDRIRKSRVDPIQPGVSVSHILGTAGTLGAIVFDSEQGTPYILSNWHVLHTPEGNVGDDIVQPGPYDDPRTNENLVGKLVRSHLGLDGDCAVASIEGRDWVQEILGLDVVPQRTAAVELDDEVVKSGRTTGVTYGIVKRVAVTANINYGGSVGVRQIGCFEIGPNPRKLPADGEISSGGDSGSLWMIDDSGDDGDVSVGLHFAGETDPSPDAEHALACPIRTVLDKLRVSLVPPEPEIVDESVPWEDLLTRISHLESCISQPAEAAGQLEWGGATFQPYPGGEVAMPAGYEIGEGFADAEMMQAPEFRSAIEATQSNRNDVRSRIAAGNWNIVWGVTINEAEYLKFIAACAAAFSSGNLGALAAYFKDYLNRSIDKFRNNAPGVARNALVKTVLQALKDRGRNFRIGRIGVKGGIATYQRWYTVSTRVPDGTERYKIRGPWGTWTWGYRIRYKTITKKVPLPNHHQPFVGFRLY